jgi:hypothetical protein
MIDEISFRQINAENILRVQSLDLAREQIARIRGCSAEQVWDEATAFFERAGMDPSVMNQFSFSFSDIAEKLRCQGHPIGPQVMLACSARMRELAEAEQQEPWIVARILISAAAVWALFISMIWFLF